MHPWDGLIPPDDVQSFAGGFDELHRQIDAGVRPALIVVDMTRAFVDSDYPTGWSPTGYPCVAANKQLLASARQIGIPIFFTKAYADPTYRPTLADRGRWKSRTRKDADPSLPPADVIVEDLTPRADEIVITKGSKPSGFFGTPLASRLIYEGVDTVIVTGMTTSGCVRATVVDAFEHNFYVLVPHECVADRSQISHKVNLFDIHMKYADVVSLDEAQEYLQQVAGRAKAPVLT